MDPSPSSDSSALEAALSGGPLGAAPAPQRTLPPPEWLGREAPRSAASVALEQYSAGRAVPRKVGPRAELHTLHARMTAACAAGDDAAERDAAAQLARALVQRGAEFDQATRLARRALLLREDRELREELSSWFGFLGEPALAAATLRPLLNDPSADAGSLLTRIGTLLARAGEARGAREAFEEAAEESSADPLPAELGAAIGAWAPEVVTPERSAALYLEAAERRERIGERAIAFEDTLRAFEMAPESAAAADRLARLLLERGRVGAADEVRREHARHAGPAARAVHLRRLREALRDGDLPRAFGAALDARLEYAVDVHSALGALGGSAGAESQASEHNAFGFDELLTRLGLNDLIAARLELACDTLAGRERSRAALALARLYSGALSRPERAVESWTLALIEDPTNDEARQALVRHAALTRDPVALVDALVRVGEGAVATPERIACLRELLLLAEERLSAPELSLWAAERIRAVQAEPDLGATIARLRSAVAEGDEAIARVRLELERASGADRSERLFSLSCLLQYRPDQADALLPVLLELVELAPEARTQQAAVERLLIRQGRLEELEGFYLRLLGQPLVGSERASLRLSLANVRRKRGDLAAAVAALAPLLDEPSAYPAPLCMLLLLAGQTGDDLLRARALLRLSALLTAPVRAVVAALAGELLLGFGEVEAARRAVDQASSAEPSLARPVAARAAVGMVTGDRWGADAMERALGVVVPRAKLCEALAAIYWQLGEPLLSLAFGQRRIALRPSDLAAARWRLERSVELDDALRIADALSSLLAQPQPLEEVSALVAHALRKLAPLDPSRGATLARRALDVLGPRSTELRLSVLSVADIVGERGLGITVLERWLASGADSSDRAEILLDLARRRRASGDVDGSARSLLRAMRDGAWGTAVLAELDVAPPPRTSDGETALLAARAEALSATSEADQRGTATAWRELGAAYWDLAGDVASALRAWERAAVLDPELGPDALASDLVAFAGVDGAVAQLAAFASRRGNPRDGARLLALAAALALEAGRNRTALDIAVRALTLDSSRADVLGVAEHAAGDEDLATLELLYARLADVALGCFGERAVHYRAARQLERRRLPERALDHAIRAFEAVPSEGSAFVTLARLAERVADPIEIVRSIERVAARTADMHLRASWLRRAASLTGHSVDGLRQRFEVLLRALAVRPDAELLVALGDAARELTRAAPDERDVVELRLARALAARLSDARGPAGARVAILGAKLLLEAFDAVEPAVGALDRAVDCDASVDEYEALLRFAPRLAPGTGHWVERLRALAATTDAHLGASVLMLGAKLAETRSDASSAAALWAAAAQRRPQDAELAGRAERTARDLADTPVEALPRDVQLLRNDASSARQAGDQERLVQALTALVALDPDSSEQLVLLRELAALLEQRGELASAQERWRAVLALDPSDMLALSALEREAERRGDYETLIGILGSRAALAVSPDEVRGVRLRRATVLEQRLGRPEEARAELEALTTATGDHLSVLRVLSDLDERLGEPLRAAPLWLRASAITTDRAEALDLSCKACEAYLVGGDVESARRVLEGMLPWARVERVLELTARVERRAENPLALAEALDDWAVASSQGPEFCAALLVEAARASLSGGALEEALGRAERAARLLPNSAEAQLLARSLEYRIRAGISTREQAEFTVLELSSIEGELSAEQRELFAFLLAEALDAAPGSSAGAGLRELERVEQALGRRPLLALGLADRLSRTGRAEQSLAYYDAALEGDLRDLVPRSQVVLRAADAARAVAERAVAERAVAERAVAERAVAERAVAERALTEPALTERISSMPPIGRRPSLDPRLLGALDRAASPGRYSQRADIAEQRPALELAEPGSDPGPPSEQPGRYSLRAHADRASSRPPLAEAAEAEQSSTQLRALNASEAELFAELADGSVEAGKELLRILEHRSDRTHDRVVVCRRLCNALPTEPWALNQLHEAALADKNTAYARAVEHVLRVLEPGSVPVEPPPLAEQQEQPDAVRALLLREQPSAAHEALALVWEGAEHVFRRDPSTYGITGLERVPVGAPTLLARVYTAAVRALGLLRTPLFQRRSTGPITVSLALLSPPAIVLSGDVRHESAELRYHLGATLIAALPQFALLIGAAESQARGLLQGLAFAFGPPQRTPGPGGVPHLAEVLWESIPPRLQRRLRELCDGPEALDYATAMRSARLAARRTGLFVCGDLGVALRETAVEEAAPAHLLESGSGLADFCRQSVSARSLLRLATSAEYAETRWQPISKGR